MLEIIKPENQETFFSKRTKTLGLSQAFSSQPTILNGIYPWVKKAE